MLGFSFTWDLIISPVQAKVEVERQNPHFKDSLISSFGIA